MFFRLLNILLSIVLTLTAFCRIIEHQACAEFYRNFSNAVGRKTNPVYIYGENLSGHFRALIHLQVSTCALLAWTGRGTSAAGTAGAVWSTRRRPGNTRGSREE